MIPSSTSLTGGERNAAFPVFTFLEPALELSVN
jgi:hypothetical protein